MSTIRPFDPADRAACLALFDSNVPEFFLPGERAEFETWLGQPFGSGEYGEYFVLEDEGRVVACGGVWLSPEGGGPKLGHGRAGRSPPGLWVSAAGLPAGTSAGPGGA